MRSARLKKVQYLADNADKGDGHRPRQGRAAALGGKVGFA
jgi:hypothetical protein